MGTLLKQSRRSLSIYRVYTEYEMTTSDSEADGETHFSRVIVDRESPEESYREGFTSYEQD